MASALNTAILGALALLLWTSIGLVASRRLLPQALIWPSAPALGFALQSAVALPLFMFLGFSRVAVVLVLAAMFALAIYDFVRSDREVRADFSGALFAIAGVIALAAAMAVLPKGSGDAVTLAGPIYDHSKIAIVDEIVRRGVPPGNPFFGDSASGLPYYYLLHFSAGQLAALTGFGGWNADAALTWFTAFAATLLAMGLAVHLSGKRSAAMWTALLTLAGSSRPLFSYLTGRSEALEPLMSYDPGLSTLLFQVSWAPQHVASASCVVLAILLLTQAAVRFSWLAVAVLAIVMAAAFQSSVWVGGLVLALSGITVVAALLLRLPVESWRNVLLTGAPAAVAAIVLASPLLIELWRSAVGRGGEFPVALEPYPVVGDLFPDAIGNYADVPAFWLLLLPIDLTVIYVAGLLGMFWLVRNKAIQSTPLVCLTALAFVSLCVSWLLQGKISANNDLGWRAVLPAILVLTAFAAAGISVWIERRAWLPLSLTAVFFLIGVPGGVRLIYEHAVGGPNVKPAPFVQTASMWRAVREVSGGEDRIASNPAFLANATFWPINISWALQADRRSCYAGNEFALAFVPIPEERREQIGVQFARIFAGTATPEDLAEMITQYHCRVVLLTPADGAWANDAFANSALYRQVASTPGWRIYRTTESAQIPANQLNPRSSQ